MAVKIFRFVNEPDAELVDDGSVSGLEIVDALVGKQDIGSAQAVVGSRLLGVVPDTTHGRGTVFRVHIATQFNSGGDGPVRDRYRAAIGIQGDLLGVGSLMKVGRDRLRINIPGVLLVVMRSVNDNDVHTPRAEQLRLNVSRQGRRGTNAPGSSPVLHHIHTGIDSMGYVWIQCCDGFPGTLSPPVHI